MARRLTTTTLILILICIAGFGLRAWKVIDPNPVPGDDAHAYYALATSLYEDATFGGPDFNNSSDWSPGAPLLYAGLFHVTGGPREGSIRALQALIGLASILLAFQLAARLGRQPASSDGAERTTASAGNPETAGLLGAAGVAFYPPFIHSTGTTMSEPLAILLLLATSLSLLWARGQISPWAWAAPGLLAGLLALTRPEYLAVGLVFALIIVWVGSASGSRIPAGVGRGLIFFAAMLVPVVPWTVHNLNTLDRLVPISTGSGKALFVGTYMPGDGDYQRTKAILAREQLGRNLAPGSKELDAVDPRPLFDQVAARHPELSRDDALGRIGRAQLEENLRRPVDYGAMLARKVWRMWSQGQGGAMRSVPGRIAQVALVLAALTGLFILARRRRWFELAILATPILAITAVGAITLASDRRGQVLMALLLPLAGMALAQFIESRRQPPPSLS